MTQIISIISGKGGVGKTTFTANMGAAFSRMGKSVLMIDGNVSGANLGIYVGVHDYSNTLNDVLDGKINFYDAVNNISGGKGSSNYFHLMPASLMLDSANLSKLSELLSTLVGHYDYILIDGAAGCDREIKDVLEVSDKAILVVNPEISSLSNAMLVKSLADNMGKDIIGVVVNRVRSENIEVSLLDIEKFLGLSLIGAVREETKVKSSLAEGVPVVLRHPDSRVSKDFMKSAENFLSGSFVENNKVSFFRRVVSSVFD